MEAVPRLPMISFELKLFTEHASFEKLRWYISNYYNEDGDSYSAEIRCLETLRSGAVRATVDDTGLELLRKYYCQLHFLKSRFPMEENQACEVYFSWRDPYSSMVCTVPDVDFELINVLYNIGALHTKLGAADSRVSANGMKEACSHFQCAAWAFQTARETYPQFVSSVSSPEVFHFMHLICLAQAQECILEKSMMDNRKVTIIAKVAVQVVDYYKQSLATLQGGTQDGSLADLLGTRTYKDWTKCINFKIAYHKSIALLYQGLQAEELQKMGERVAFYQAASDQLQEARKKAKSLSKQTEFAEALSFTGDVIEGKRKAAKNENEFIYHEDVPDKDALQEVKGASLVKGIPFSVHDPEVSGPDIFARLVPMEAHETSSVYSEQKAQLLRSIGELIETKDRTLAEFMSSMQLDVLNQMRQANGLTQDLIDRAAAINAKPNAIPDLVNAMSQLSGTYEAVESMLAEIDHLLADEERKEHAYQEQMGARPPSIVATDLTREAAKYREAHTKASDSNQHLNRAMTNHIANLTILNQTPSQLRKQIPGVDMAHPKIDQEALHELETLIAKVDEMRNQRAMLWAQLRDGIHNDDITGILVTREANQSLEQIFEQELQKHRKQAALIEQNIAAQENIFKAFIDVYQRFRSTRHFLQDVISKRNSTLSALVHSYDTYDDLLAKTRKGSEFYAKLETNVTKLLQRIRSSCHVQEEEREQMLAKHRKIDGVQALSVPETVAPPDTPVAPPLPPPSATPKLKDYLEARKAATYAAPATDASAWPPAVRPAPLGSEMNEQRATYANEPMHDGYASYAGAHGYTNPVYRTDEQNLSERMAALSASKSRTSHYNYEATPYAAPAQNYGYNSSLPLSYGTNTQTHATSQAQYPTSVSQTSDLSYMSSMPQATQATLPTTYTSLAASQPTYVSQAEQRGSAGYANPMMQNPYATPAYQSCPQPENYANQTYNVTPSATTAPPYVDYYNQYGYNYTSAGGAAFNASSAYSEAYQPASTHTTQAYGYAAICSPTVEETGAAQQSQLYYNQAYAQNPMAAYEQGQCGQAQYAQSQPTHAQYDQGQGAQVQYAPGQPAHAQYDQSQSAQVQIGQSQPTQGQFAQNPSAQTQYAPGQPAQAQYNQSVAAHAQTGSAMTYDPYQQYYMYDGQISAQTTNYYNNNTPSYGTNYATANQSAAVVSSSLQPVTQTVAVTPPSSTAQVQQPSDVARKTSNVDLLSGLDFNISQAPLQPQQKQEDPPPPPPAAKTVETTNPLTAKPSLTKMMPEQSVPALPPTKPSEKLLLPDPFHNADVLKQLEQEAEKYEKFVEMLAIKTLSGPTALELKWKEIVERQDVDVQKKSISVARCYPSKNRFSDILPFDGNRVKLISTKDDYINASLAEDVTILPLIITQCPVPATFLDFWTMVWERQVEVIVCLASDAEIENVYWPKDVHASLSFDHINVTLQSINVSDHWIERTFTLNHQQLRKTKEVVHFQFTAWPGSLIPTSPSPITKFIMAVLHHLRTTPLLIHCVPGIGRSGFFAVVLTSIIEIARNPTATPDVTSIAVKFSCVRKNVLRDREHLKFAYATMLTYMKEVCASRKVERNDVEVKQVQATHSFDDLDPLKSLDPLWTAKNMK